MKQSGIRQTAAPRWSALLFACVLLALVIASAPRAQSEPLQRQDGGVAYVSSAADAHSRARAGQLSEDMNLQLEFVGPTRLPLSDVAVEVIDARGERVLRLARARPLLLMRLEPGRYHVQASAAGQAIARAVDVPGEGRHSERLQWPSVPVR